MNNNPLSKIKISLILILLFILFVLIPYYFIFNFTEIVEIRTYKRLTPSTELNKYGDTVYIYRELRNNILIK